MIKSASPAVVAKARAIYGKRIKPNQYKELVNCKSVSDITAFLKHYTSYTDQLSNVNESTIHRGQLEIFLRTKIFKSYSTLYYYLDSSNNSMFHYIIQELEIQEILRMILLLKSGSPDKFISSMPTFLIPRCDIDMFNLAKARTFNELMAVLDHTPYAKILKKTITDDPSKIDYTACEHLIYEYFFKKTFNMIDQKTKGTERLELRRLLGMRIDQLNACSIYRSKFILEADDKDAAKKVFPFHRKIKPSTINEIISTSNKEQVEQILHSIFDINNPDMVVPEYGSNYLEKYTERVNFKTCKNLLHVSQNVSTVFYAFYILSEIELSNLIYIIEGVRYELPASDIEKLLIQ